jgi:chemotaxis receptor (MCP) glutamine deamidase CheD
MNSPVDDPEHRQLVSIHIGDLCVSAHPTTVRTVLGSCVAVCLFDPVVRIGGMNHFLLPRGSRDGQGAARFGVHSMELLINAMMKLGADRERFVAKVFGAAHVLAGRVAGKSVSQDNSEFVQQFLKDEGIPVVGGRLGGTLPLSVRFETETGRAQAKTLGRDQIASIENEEQKSLTVRDPFPSQDVTFF